MIELLKVLDRIIRTKSFLIRYIMYRKCKKRLKYIIKHNSCMDKLKIILTIFKRYKFIDINENQYIFLDADIDGFKIDNDGNIYIGTYKTHFIIETKMKDIYINNVRILSCTNFYTQTEFYMNDSYNPNEEINQLIDTLLIDICRYIIIHPIIFREVFK